MLLLAGFLYLDDHVQAISRVYINRSFHCTNLPYIVFLVPLGCSAAPERGGPYCVDVILKILQRAQSMNFCIIRQNLRSRVLSLGRY